MLRARLFFVIASGYGLATHAETLALPQDTYPTTHIALPDRGARMPAVEARFGAPAKRFAPVGGGKPEHPPITRWDYADFSVFFERDRVIDAVVKEAPKPLRNTEALRPAS